MEKPFFRQTNKANYYNDKVLNVYLLTLFNNSKSSSKPLYLEVVAQWLMFWAADKS